jgi:hypothetical protein
MVCGEGGAKEMPGCLKSADDAPKSGVTSESQSKSSFGTAVSCAAGELALGIQNDMSGNPIGRLYAPNVLDEWTEDVSDAGRRAAEIYWNVSTWNPYQVVLVKTRLSVSR